MSSARTELKYATYTCHLLETPLLSVLFFPHFPFLEFSVSQVEAISSWSQSNFGMSLSYKKCPPPKKKKKQQIHRPPAASSAEGRRQIIISNTFLPGEPGMPGKPGGPSANVTRLLLSNVCTYRSPLSPFGPCHERPHTVTHNILQAELDENTYAWFRRVE